MPIYGYRCANCSAETETRQSYSDAPLTTCESCGGSVRRVLHPVGVIFKGSGFYSTDNRNGRNGKAATEGSGESGDKTPAAATTGDGGSSKTAGGDASSAPAKSIGGEKATTASSPASSGTKTE